MEGLNVDHRMLHNAFWDAGNHGRTLGYVLDDPLLGLNTGTLYRVGFDARVVLTIHTYVFERGML